MKQSILLLGILSLLSFNSYSQCGDVVEQCRDKLKLDPLSQGGSVQQLLLLNDNIRLLISLAANTTYRVAFCSGQSNNEMFYRIVDKKNNTLAYYDEPEAELESVEYEAEPYTQFVSQQAGRGLIVARLQRRTEAPVCAALAIGFESAK